MNELIWFSVPGAILVSACVLAGIVPTVDSSEIAILIVASVPIVGFVFHQLFRIFFEKCFGFDWSKRTVISEIKKKWPDDDLSNQEAFLIWEITFYSDCFPAAFRSHDRGAWHYIISFWTGALAALIGAIFVASVYDSKSLLFLFVSIVLLRKGYLTWNSLREQEVVIFKKCQGVFEDTKNLLRAQ